MKLTVGILAVGSLYWDNDRREIWRQSRLKLDREFPVAVPIRYGRISSSRGCTYTMVFDPDLKELGKAKAIECSNVISSVSGLICEAEHLWTAERKKQPNGKLSEEWGCVALLPNPKSEMPKELLDEWTRRISQEQSNYKPLSSAAMSSVTENGLLKITWPELVEDGPLKLDLLLATANSPSLEGNPLRFPEPDTIAKAWGRASKEYPSKKYDNYFWKNREHGITTFQDNRIEKMLEEMGIHAQ